MKKIYCRNCQEKIKEVDGMYERVIKVDYLDPTECLATGGEHVPR